LATDDAVTKQCKLSWWSNSKYRY